MYAQDLEPTPFADENVDDLGDVSDVFQESFFEALKQKGIENYDRAIDALEICIQQEPKMAVLYFERGKNELLLKRYAAAEESLVQSLELKPEQEDVLEQLYDVYYKTRDFDKAERTIKKLIPFDVQYKEDLARLYLLQKKYDASLALIDELDAEKGRDMYRDTLRNRIYKLSGNTQKVTESAEQQALASGSEKDYLKLIYVYSEQGNAKKAYETALALQKLNPEAIEVQLALYKFYLSDGKTDLAIKAMQAVLSSPKLDGQAKHKVLNDFVQFVTANPEYEPALETAVSTFDNQVQDAKIYGELGAYYLSKKQNEKAVVYYSKASDKEPANFELIKKTVLLLIETGDYDQAAQRAEAGLGLFPSQPLLYLSLGAAQNGLTQYDNAIENLEIGVDYLIDNPTMEADFYNQLAIAYTAKGDVTKAAKYISKAKALKAQSN